MNHDWEDIVGPDTWDVRCVRCGTEWSDQAMHGTCETEEEKADGIVACINYQGA